MPTITTLREAVGLFHDARVLRNAADTLMLNGFDRADLSILAGEAAIREKLHNAYTTDELEDQPTVPTLAYYGGDSLTELKAATIGGPFFIGAVSASAAIIADNGTLTAALVAALVAGGVAAALGAILVGWLTRHHNTYLDAQLRRGGLLLWVRTVDAAHEERACRILKEGAAEHVHVHNVPHNLHDEWRGPGKVVYGVLEFLAGAHRPA